MSHLRKRVKHYGKLPSATIRDPRLSDAALGLLLRIVDLPENWIVRADTLAAGRPQGRDATARALRNLAACGYYRVERRKMRTGRFQMGTAISEDSLPTWEAEYAEFEGKPIPLIEQTDGTFRVRRKDGTTTDDGFVGIYAPEAADPESLGETAGQTGNGMSGSGKEMDHDPQPETDISGPGISGSGEPDSGFRGPFSTTEKYSPEVENPAVVLAVGEPPTVTRAAEAPAANRKDQLGREAWATVAALPRRYRDGLPTDLRFGMVHEIRTAFYQQYGSEALIRYARLCASNPDYGNDKHIPLLRAAIALLRQDVRLGLACRTCGDDLREHDPFGPPCPTCRPDREEMSEADLAELEAARRFLDGDGPTAADLDALGEFADGLDGLDDDLAAREDADGDGADGGDLTLFDDRHPGPDRQPAHAGPQGPQDGATRPPATDESPGPYGEADGDLRGVRGASETRDRRRGHAGGADPPR